jgi:hypothetical protein
MAIQDKRWKTLVESHGGFDCSCNSWQHIVSCIVFLWLWFLVICLSWLDIVIVACGIYDLNLVLNLIIKTQIPHSENFLNIYSLVGLRKNIKISHIVVFGKL